MIYLPVDQVTSVAERLAGDGFQVRADLVSLTGTDQVLSMSRSVADAYMLPDGLRLDEQPDTWDEHDVDRIQSLQFAGGLIPLPQDDILNPQAYGVVLRDASSAVVGFASALDIASHEQRLGWHQVNGVCLDTGYRGQGLGTYLTARSILSAHRTGFAERFISSVEAGNVASIRMQTSCGLEPDGQYAFIFARVSQREEVELLSSERRD
jgi:GNAT superfamily N-acetyltransferase